MQVASLDSPWASLIAIVPTYKAAQITNEHFMLIKVRQKTWLKISDCKMTC